MCLKDNKIYNYHDISPTSDMESFAKSLSSYGYNIDNWIDTKEPQINGNIVVYSNANI